MIDMVIPLWLYPILIWTLAWKAVGAWKSARNGHLIWFVAFFVFNTMGILPIIYLLFFQNMKSFEGADGKVKKKGIKKNFLLSLNNC